DVPSDRDVRDVADPDRGPARIRRDDRELEVLLAGDVPATAERVFVLRHLDDAATHLGVRAAHRRGDLSHAHPARLHADGIDFDLVLLLEAADRRDLGDAGDGLEPVTELPVLQAAQLLQVALPTLVDERVL